ncbi:hypothetical protein G6F35_019162 [Rhizopus arrhizus]|nr:hypothetical protein G6F40_016060 [Rhizopus arrhizus]KAG1159207.1 hypothetical protein G6F35_019162 [Rhizopus arrhizus]
MAKRFGGQRGEHQDMATRIDAAHPGDHAQAIQLRNADVQDHHIRRLIPEHLYSINAIADLANDPKAVRLQQHAHGKA